MHVLLDLFLAVTLARAGDDEIPVHLSFDVVPFELEGDQVVNPAQAQDPKDQTDPGKKLVGREQVIYVKAEKYAEEDRVGAYRQPEWTQHRRWPATRVYLQQPPGGIEFEQWLEIRIPKKGGKRNEVRLREEFEFGLGDRFQLDIYYHTVYKERLNGEASTANTLDFRAWSGELRYALADWGEIFGNPTLYFEYILFNDAEASIEPKLLLGGEIVAGFHWGANLVYERELAGFKDRTEEFKVTLGLSHTISDTKFSVGISAEGAYTTEREDSTTAAREREIHLGPSIQYRPIPKAHVDIEPMWGCTGESKRLKMFLVFGWDF